LAGATTPVDAIEAILKASSINSPQLKTGNPQPVDDRVAGEPLPLSACAKRTQDYNTSKRHPSNDGAIFNQGLSVFEAPADARKYQR
jgi:hypothetical protein